LSKPFKVPAEFAQAPGVPVPVRIWEPAPGIEGVAWLDSEGQHHIILRSQGNAATLRLSAAGRSAAAIRRAGASKTSDELLPATVVLPAAVLRKESFLLSNPSFGATNVHFECETGYSPPSIEVQGVAPDALEIAPG
jgi:hypothetical protein